MKIVEQHSKVAIEPKDVNIDSSKGFTRFWGTFLSVEAEDAACRLVTEAQAQSSWHPIPLDVVTSCIDTPFLTRGMQDLLNQQVIIFQNGKYHFTYDFVGRVYASSPAI